MATRRSTSAAVVSDEAILGGVPVVKGTRIPADTVLAEVRTGKSRFEIFRSYPSLPVDGIDACLAWEKRGASAMRDPFLIGECLSPDLVAIAHSRGFDACNCPGSILCPLNSSHGSSEP